MTTENFLINPPKKLRYRRRKRNPIGETLVTIGANRPMRRIRRKNPENPWYGDSGGHRIAALMRWGKVRRGKIKRHRKVGRPRVRRVKVQSVKRRVVRRKAGRRWAPVAVRQQRKLAQHAFWADKYGEMLAHPRRRVYKYKTRGVKYYMKRLRRRKANTWFGQPKRHRKAAKKGWRRGHMLLAGTRRRRVRHANPMVASTNPRRRRKSVKYSSRRRRNPAMMAEFGKFTSGIMNVREWGPLAVTGGLSAMTGAVVPGMIGVVDPWMKLGVQTAVAIGGGIVVERVVDKRHGQAWMIVGVAMVGYQLLKQFVIQPYFPQFAVGLGEYQSYYPTSAYEDQMNVSQQVGAFPTAMSAYPGVGAFENEVGAYPYDGAGY